MDSVEVLASAKAATVPELKATALEPRVVLKDTNMARLDSAADSPPEPKDSPKDTSRVRPDFPPETRVLPKATTLEPRVLHKATTLEPRVLPKDTNMARLDSAADSPPALTSLAKATSTDRPELRVLLRPEDKLTATDKPECTVLLEDSRADSMPDSALPLD